jgi:hypothetical protein
MRNHATTVTAAGVAASGASLLLTGCTTSPTASSARTEFGMCTASSTSATARSYWAPTPVSYTLTDAGTIAGPVDGTDSVAMGQTATSDALYVSRRPGPATPTELGERNLGIIRSLTAGTAWIDGADLPVADLAGGTDGGLYAQLKTACGRAGILP